MKYLLFASAWMLTLGLGYGQSSTLLNPLDWEVKDALVRLKTPAPTTSFIVTENDKPVPYQVEGNTIWVVSTFPPRSTHMYLVAAGQPPPFTPRVKVVKTDAMYEMDNGIVAIRVPASGTAGPITGIKLDGKWVGSSSWKTPPTQVTATQVGDGTLLGKVRLQYEFAGKKWAEVTVTVAPGWHHALIEERYQMDRDDYYEILLSDGWKPTNGLSIPYADGFQKKPAPKPNRALRPGGLPFEREELFIRLIPRWNQSCQDGWFFAAYEGQQALGAMVTRASRWFWPHDSAIEVMVKPTGDYAALRCPTWHGARLWFLMAGPITTEFAAGRSPRGYVSEYALESLDKLNHELILEWPGVTGRFVGMFPYDNTVNPTAGIRGFGRGAIQSADKPGDYSTLTQAQMMMHPDTYGSYYLYWSPQNPNFFTDFMKGPIAMVARLKDHPRFKELAALAEAKLREDVDHSITLPGGAGQECPGYQLHGDGGWGALAPLATKHLGFDPLTWERVKASNEFRVRISQPDGEIRRMLPMGDTHPQKGFGPAKLDVPADLVKTWSTTELPGFGVIFQNRAGTPQETYMAFKSGPNRGHYHGDQLAFHYCAQARPLVVDHHCSYAPRAGQEHMHNRVAFGTDAMPWANMDGYERLIAFKTNPVADVAIGQVESDRLRQVVKLPPEDWNAHHPQHKLSKPLSYRRTVVLVKDGPQDYFVIRDQYSSGDELNAAYCLHVRSDQVEQKGPVFDFGNLTLLCARPAAFGLERLDWSHENGVPESTVGVRLATKGKTGDWITVLYPGKAPAWSALPQGVKVGDDEITFSDDLPVLVKRGGKEVVRLALTDIDDDRCQGKIGLFVPDAGYPFGRIPDWLIRQRASDDEQTARAKAWPLKP